MKGRPPALVEGGPKWAPHGSAAYEVAHGRMFLGSAAYEVAHGRMFLVVCRLQNLFPLGENFATLINSTCLFIKVGFGPLAMVCF